MKLYSYIVTHDTGFSPNPFWGYCTLADCKPAIRRTASVGDWIVGLSPKARGNRLVYAMKVDEILTYEKYFRDRRFTNKIPAYNKGNVVNKCGDNIYRPLRNGGFKQLQSMHSNGKNENLETKSRDLWGKNVLISETFYYFGQKALGLPKKFEALKVGRAHKCKFSPEIISDFIAFIRRRNAGINAPPTNWPSNDDSWKAGRL
ncbi:MAG: hypothetical protein ACFFDN_37480 [Candidatus Hodarchaeota archaeon]